MTPETHATLIAKRFGNALVIAERDYPTSDFVMVNRQLLRDAIAALADQDPSAQEPQQRTVEK